MDDLRAPAAGDLVVVELAGGGALRGILLPARPGVRLGGLRLAVPGEEGVVAIALRDVVTVRREEALPLAA